jgi:Protein of unknown function (DUF3175)
MTERKHKDRKWSAEVTEHSDALDLEADIFESDDPAKIAHSLKRSAERSNRRKSAPFRSAMSMLTFYINRAGKNLSPDRKKTLEAAKAELRRAFGQKEKVSTGKLSWARGSVRDANVPLVDALALASWLRSSTTTRRFTDRTRSLTVYDAHNVQSLAAAAAPGEPHAGSSSIPPNARNLSSQWMS